MEPNNLLNPSIMQQDTTGNIPEWLMQYDIKSIHELINSKNKINSLDHHNHTPLFHSVCFGKENFWYV